jgi:hypothetical protein
MAAVAVSDVAAKGGDLNNCRLGGDAAPRRPGQRYQHNAKLRSYGVGFREDGHDLFRCGIGGDIKIGRLAAEQQIADTSADEVRLVASAP